MWDIYRSVVINWNDDVTEPLILFGKIEFNKDVEFETRRWALWNSWFDDKNDNKNPDYKVREFEFDEDGYKSKFLAIPLIDLKNKSDIENKIVKTLLDL